MTRTRGFRPEFAAWRNLLTFRERLREYAPPVDVLRTPDDCFADLPGWTFAPHYLDLDGLRVHYVDEGPPAAAPVLLLHGEPSWGYLYRKMIAPLVAAGHRVVVPDLVGFGRSDKPVRRDVYTYQRHVDWMAGVLMRLAFCAPIGPRLRSNP